MSDHVAAESSGEMGRVFDSRGSVDRSSIQLYTVRDILVFTSTP
jgi:hypothetical protein